MGQSWLKARAGSSKTRRSRFLQTAKVHSHRFSFSDLIAHQAAIHPSIDKILSPLKFNVTFVIDDSGVMEEFRWLELKEALKNITDLCRQYDGKGIEICFMNDPNRYEHITKPGRVEEILNSVHPQASRPIVARLASIMRTPLEQGGKDAINPRNIIIVTGGEATDEGDDAAPYLAAVPSHICIQVLHIRDNSGAKEIPQGFGCKLADRNIIDYYDCTSVFSGKGILELMLGAVNRGSSGNRTWRKSIGEAC